ncbi:MAG: hypothetical protein M1838_004117 [Thelocarpon superellum]|nr:MAG: hypothetical protein M1838_004117 [Thelocarpon superellum]
MADPDATSASRSSGEFVESAVLETLVPRKTDIDIESELSAANALDDDQNASPLSKIAQRRLLYFDERLVVYVILRTPYQEEHLLTSYLSRLVIALDAHAVNLHPPPPPPNGRDDSPTAPTKPARDLIFSGTVNELEDPLIIVHGGAPDSEEEDPGHVFAVWKLNVFLGRPRMRIANPVVTFAATATLKPAEQVSPTVRDDDYLPSQVPAGLNLLEALQDDPALAHVAPRLSALRVSRVVPAAPVTRELLRPLRNSSQQSFRVVPAASARMRYATVAGPARKTSTIASLEVEVTPVADCAVRLDDVALRLTDGTCEPLTGSHDAWLPLTCRPRDDMTLLYRLAAAAERAESSLHHPSPVRTLEIRMSLTALVDDDCRPIILMHWQSDVDLSTPARTHGPSRALPRRTSLTSTGSAAPSGEWSGTMEDFGITLSISGPPTVYKGRAFDWTVLVLNRSQGHRKLALVPLPSRRRAESKRAPSRMAMSTTPHRGRDLALAVADENITYTMQKSAAIEPAELLSLSADVRVGPLAPGACHAAALTFLPLDVGVLRVDAVRVVDLATQHTIEVLELPSVVCYPDTPGH